MKSDDGSLDRNWLDFISLHIKEFYNALESYITISLVI